MRRIRLRAAWPAVTKVPLIVKQPTLRIGRTAAGEMHGQRAGSIGDIRSRHRSGGSIAGAHVGDLTNVIGPRNEIEGSRDWMHDEVDHGPGVGAEVPDAHQSVAAVK